MLPAITAAEIANAAIACMCENPLRLSAEELEFYRDKSDDYYED